jgi:hypothetical protein
VINPKGEGKDLREIWLIVQLLRLFGLPAKTLVIVEKLDPKTDTALGSSLFDLELVHRRS